MKKILIVLNIFLCYFLFGCNTSVNSSIYISSMGFEVIDGQLVTYFLSNPLADISRNKDEKDNNNQYVKVESKSIFEAFRDAEKSLLSPLNFRHIKTAILSKEFIESKYLEEFLIYLKKMLLIILYGDNRIVYEIVLIYMRGNIFRINNYIRRVL